MDSTQLDSFQRWRDARQQLDDALLHFHKATNDLDATLSSHSMDPELLEKATMEADQISCSMAMRIGNLNTIHITLNKIRNRSTSLVPINKLPLEVLLHILRFAVQEHHGSPYNYYTTTQQYQTANTKLFALSHTCTRWRLLVRTTTSFWSKIHLKYDDTSDFSTTCNRVRTYLERANGQPLDVDFHGGSISSRREVAMIVKALRQHFKYVQLLRLIDFDYPNAHLDLITALLTYGQPGSLQTLTIWCKYAAEFSARIHSTNPKLTQQRIDSFLLPIRYLCLGGVYFDWDSPVYHNLVRLQLSAISRGKSPTLPQILGILSACPELESLQLQDSQILAGDNALLEPVVLTKLADFDLQGMDPESISLLLPMIISSSRGLSMRIDLYSNASNAGRTVQSFLLRTNVTRLYIDHPVNPDGIAGYLSAVPNLNVLILDLNLEPGNDILAAITHSSQSTDNRTAICPNLCTLYLINGSLQNEAVQAAVEAHPRLKKLRFISCFLEPFDEELLYWLKPYAKDVECITRLTGARAYWYRDLT